MNLSRNVGILGAFFILIVLVLVWYYVLNSTDSSSFVKDNVISQAPRKFGIVIDCGSSGSRVFIYSWLENSQEFSSTLPVLTQLTDALGKVVAKKVEPGLSSLGATPSKASDHLLPLLQFALAHISAAVNPENAATQVDATSRVAGVWIYATAGLRMLNEMTQTHLIDDALTDLPIETNLAIPRQNIQVISGELEGVFAWLSVNYALGTLKPSRQSVASVDMGGGSLQLTFQTSHAPRPPVQEVTLGGSNNFAVFSKTWLGLGANEAKRRYYAQTAFNTSDPCTNRGRSTKLANDMTIQGSGNFKECLDKLSSMFKNEMLPFFVSNVTLPGVVKDDTAIPTLPPNSCGTLICGENLPPRIFGFSEIYYSSYDVLGLQGPYDEAKLIDKSVEFCSKRWDQVLSMFKRQAFPNAQINRLEDQCFKAAWLHVIIHQALNLENLTPVSKLNDVEVHWSLGALLFSLAKSPQLLSESIFHSNPSSLSPQQPSNSTFWTLTVAGVLVVMVICCCLATGSNSRLKCLLWQRVMSVIDWIRSKTPWKESQDIPLMMTHPDSVSIDFSKASRSSGATIRNVASFPRMNGGGGYMKLSDSTTDQLV